MKLSALATVFYIYFGVALGAAISARSLASASMPIGETSVLTREEAMKDPYIHARSWVVCLRPVVTKTLLVTNNMPPSL
jgi:hypothetical protein